MAVKKQYNKNKLIKNAQTQLMNAVADELETEPWWQGGEYRSMKIILPSQFLTTIRGSVKRRAYPSPAEHIRDTIR